MTSNWSILAVLTICWRSCTEPELFCSCLTPYFLRSKANWWFGCCLFWSSFGVFWFVWMCSVWLVVAFVCGFTLALLYQDRGFLNMVPVIVFTTTATIVTMSAAWDQKKSFSVWMLFRWLERPFAFSLADFSLYIYWFLDSWECAALVEPFNFSHLPAISARPELDKLLALSNFQARRSVDTWCETICWTDLGQLLLLTCWVCAVLVLYPAF